jgi:3-methyl-2-oxobutanoate hydroxymethyltransferase
MVRAEKGREKSLKTTIYSLKQMKSAKKKIAMLTSYDCPTAKLIDESGIDVVLVGDSVGNAVLGYENTIPVTMDEMLHHVKAAARGVKNAMVVADMPFMSFQLGPKEAFYNASRFVKEAGANAVKIEGVAYIDTIKKLIDAGIPVMGHLGFTPQLINQLGGYRVQGKTSKTALAMIKDAKLLEKAGVFAIVLEMVPAALAKKIAKAVSIPVIGIGAGKDCDGQVLVINDLLGLSVSGMPKFAKKYADLHGEMKKAVSAYISDVRRGRFPGSEHSF